MQMSSLKGLNIIAFQFPYPANYGGAIEVFEKLKTLKESGFYIILHAFLYDREYNSCIEDYADEVHCYIRKKRMTDQLYMEPFIVKSRESEELLANLCENSYPILFEGLHTCSFLNHKALKDRIRWVRAHNIEHHYYQALSHGKCGILKKAYFRIEALKLQRYESVLKSADAILAITEKDKLYFDSVYSGDRTKIVHLPCFSAEPVRKSGITIRNQILYHGNLAVIENQTAVEYIIDHYLRDFSVPVIIAGANPSDSLKIKIRNSHANITLIENPTDEELNSLIQSSKINLLLTFQSTGIKLKLIKALRLGTYVVANPEMISGTGLDDFCEIAQNEDLPFLINKLINEPGMDESLIAVRDEKLNNMLSNQKSVSVIEQLYTDQYYSGEK